MRAAKRRVAIERSAGQLDSTVPMHIYATPYLADTLRLPPLTQRFALPPAAPLSVACTPVRLPIATRFVVLGSLISIPLAACLKLRPGNSLSRATTPNPAGRGGVVCPHVAMAVA